MKRLLLTFTVASAVMLSLSSCTGRSSEQQAQEWLERAQKLSESGDYSKAMASIDSLRKKFPDAIEARKAALKLYQKVNLESAQKTVESADRALQEAEAEYERMKNTVSEVKKRGEATAAQLSGLTRLRMKRDSLRTVFDVECAKIKYIKAKMKER